MRRRRDPSDPSFLPVRRPPPPSLPLRRLPPPSRFHSNSSSRGRSDQIRSRAPQLALASQPSALDFDSLLESSAPVLFDAFYELPPPAGGAAMFVWIYTAACDCAMSASTTSSPATRCSATKSMFLYLKTSCSVVRCLLAGRSLRILHPKQEKIITSYHLYLNPKLAVQHYEILC